MKKIILLGLILVAYSGVIKAVSPSTYTVTVKTSPSSGSVTVGTTTGFTASISWVSTVITVPGTSTLTPIVVYVIQPNYSVIIGTTGSHTITLGNDTVRIYGKLGFYCGTNILQTSSSGYIDIKSGGSIGYGTSNGVCTSDFHGTSKANVTIGSNQISGPFQVVGPDHATQSTTFFSSSSFWTGSVSGNWTTSANWSGTVVPTSSQNIIVPVTNPITGSVVTTFPYLPTGTTTQIAKLTIYPGATFTVNTGAYLTTTDSITNNGTIVVQSDGGLIQTTSSNLGGNGTFKINRTIPGSDVSFISSPVNNQSATGFGITPTGTDGGQIIPQSTCDGSAVDPSSPYGNLLELHENPTVLYGCAQSLWFVKSAGVLTNGRGYSLNNSATTLVYSGTVNNGSVSYSGLTRQSGTITNGDGSTITRGWHIVGNPYPSAIILTGAELSAMGFDNQIQIYDVGSWDASDPLTSITLPIGQAFQIRVATVGGTGNFSLDNSFRSIASPATFRSSQNPREHYLNILFDDNTYTDSTMVYFYDGATDGFDSQFDANRFMDAPQFPVIYSVADNERLRYNALPLLNQGDLKVVPLGIRPANQGNHKLTFHDVNTLNGTVVLEDKKLNTLTNITEGSVYNFTTQQADSANRFSLRVSGSPVATGIDKINGGGSIKLYPNPTSGNTSLVLSTNIGYTKAIIADIFGRTIQTYDFADNELTKTLTTSELNVGVYFVKLTGNNIQATLKLIKQ